jgi:hypothetical protein
MQQQLWFSLPNLSPHILCPKVLQHSSSMVHMTPPFTSHSWPHGTYSVVHSVVIKCSSAHRFQWHFQHGDIHMAALRICDGSIASTTSNTVHAATDMVLPSDFLLITV